LKKKVPEEEGMMQPPEEAGRIGRKKKTPAELAAEANADSDDEDFASKFSSLCCCMNFV
jgi:complexin-1/2